MGGEEGGGGLSYSTCYMYSACPSQPPPLLAPRACSPALLLRGGDLLGPSSPRDPFPVAPRQTIISAGAAKGLGEGRFWPSSTILPPLQVLLRGGEPLGLAFFHAEPLAMKGFDQEDLNLFNEVCGGMGEEGGEGSVNKGEGRIWSVFLQQGANVGMAIVGDGMIGEGGGGN